MKNEWRELLIPRLSPGLDHHINLPPGWKLPLLKLVKQLDDLLGNGWKISRVDCKHAELFFSVDAMIIDRELGEQMTKYIHDAEKDCRVTCQDCGGFGELVSRKYRPLIICEDCTNLRKQQETQ